MKKVAGTKCNLMNILNWNLLLLFKMSKWIPLLNNQQNSTFLEYENALDNILILKSVYVA